MIDLPRKDKEGLNYLSYSQKNKWKKKRRDYIRQYFFGEKEDNKLLKVFGDFGHKVGESFEHNNFSGWGKEEADFLKSLPCYDEFEREIRLDLDGFYTKGFIDSNTKIEDGFIKKLLDYKTGDIEKRKPEYEDKDYDQTEIYAAALKQEFGKLPEDSIVVLIGRSGNAFQKEELKLTKEVEIINKPITEERCKEVVDNFQLIGEEISEYYKVFKKLIK